MSLPSNDSFFSFAASLCGVDDEGVIAGANNRTDAADAAVCAFARGEVLLRWLDDSCPDLVVNGSLSPDIFPLDLVSTTLWFYSCLFAFVGLVISAFGLVGNTLVVVVLWKQNPQLSSNINLMTLATTDILFLISLNLLMTVNEIVSYYNMEFFWPFYQHGLRITYYIYHANQIYNIWITVYLCIERYVAVCRPALFVRFSSVAQTIKIHILIAIVCSVYTAPRFFEIRGASFMSLWQVREARIVKVGWNYAPAPNKGFEDTPLYIWGYTILLELTLKYLVTMLLLNILNAKIVLSLRSAASIVTSKNSQDRRAEAQRNVTRACLTVVFIFIICRIPIMVTDSIISIFNALEIVDRLVDYRFVIYYKICIFLLIINSSANFFPCYIFNNNFWKSFNALCGIKRENTNLVPATTIRSAPTTTTIAPTKNKFADDKANADKNDAGIDGKNGAAHASNGEKAKLVVVDRDAVVGDAQETHL